MDMQRIFLFPEKLLTCLTKGILILVKTEVYNVYKHQSTLFFIYKQKL